MAQAKPKPQLDVKANESPSRTPSAAGAKVTVACKLPHGLRIRCFSMRTTNELVMGGGSREVKVAQAIGESILIHGNAYPFGHIPPFPIIMGYALTKGVDKDTWDKWLEDNKDSAMVRNKLVFAYEKDDMAEDAARDLAEVRSGLERLDRDGDPRRPRSPIPNLSALTEEEGRAKGAAPAEEA